MLKNNGKLGVLLAQSEEHMNLDLGVMGYLSNKLIKKMVNYLMNGVIYVSTGLTGFIV